MKHFDAVIFDMDGLLLDTERLALTAFLQACSDLGIPEQQDVFIRCIGTNEARGREVLREGLQGLVDHEQFGLVWNEHYSERITTNRIPLKEGAIELLAHIAALKKPMAVATSSPTGRAREKLHSVGILDRFDVIVGGDQVSNSKPAPDIFLKAAALLRVQPRACLALEDSDNGVRAALRAGMTVVQIPDLVQPTEALLALGHIVLNCLGDVPEHPFLQNAT